MKKCSKCGTQKPLVEFHKDKTKKDGLDSNCKTCKAQYYVQNKEKIAEQQAQYYAENKEKKAQYYAENKEKILEQATQYYAQNKEKKARYYAQNKEKKARYYVENKEKLTEKNARYYVENKEKIAEQRARYYEENKEKIAQYYEENKEKLIEKKAQYYAENKEKILEQRARYYTQRKTEQPSCVYQIINLINNKVYIGETTRGELRWEQHLRGLRGNYHPNSLLQEDFNKYGEEAFEWSILKEFEDEDKNNLLLEEARTIQQHINEGIELYNLMLTIDQLKMLTEEK